MFANQIAEKIATDLAVTSFAAAAAAGGCEIAQVSVDDFPVEASALKAVVVSAADKDTAEDFGTAAVAVEEQPVACLAFVSEN
jgi:hypothetical protein